MSRDLTLKEGSHIGPVKKLGEGSYNTAYITCNPTTVEDTNGNSYTGLVVMKQPKHDVASDTPERLTRLNKEVYPNRFAALYRSNTHPIGLSSLQAFVKGRIATDQEANRELIAIYRQRRRLVLYPKRFKNRCGNLQQQLIYT